MKTAAPAHSDPRRKMAPCFLLRKWEPSQTVLWRYFSHKRTWLTGLLRRAGRRSLYVLCDGMTAHHHFSHLRRTGLKEPFRTPAPLPSLTLAWPGAVDARLRIWGIPVA